MPAIPRMIVGTANLGHFLPFPFFTAADRKFVFDYLDKILELGCFAFDLAASYQLGATEKLIGDWTRSRGNREQVYLITKGAHPYPVICPNRLNREAISNDLHDSLRRLQTDSIDLYLLHRDCPGAALAPIVETIRGFLNQGKIKAWGVSNWSHSRIHEIGEIASSLGVASLSASSPHFSLAEWVKAPFPGCVSIAGEQNRYARDFYSHVQLPVLAWAPLGGGFFSPQVRRSCLRTYGSSKNFERRSRAEILARKYQVTTAQIALSYLYSQNFPVFSVVASRTVENMAKNIQAAAVKISHDEMEWLNFC